MKLIFRSVLRSILRVMFLIIVIWFMTHGSLAQAATPRGTKAPAEFRKYTACPATNKFTGPCPGYIMDHMVPLRCNGPDVATNLQWQTRAESDAKDRWEGQCWRYFKGHK